MQNCRCFHYNFLFIAFLDYHLNKLYINKLHRNLFIQYPTLKPYFLTEVKRQMQLVSLIINVQGIYISSKLGNTFKKELDSIVLPLRIMEVLMILPVFKINVNDLPHFAAGWQTLYKVKHSHPHKWMASSPRLYSLQDHSLIQFASREDAHIWAS